jgi:hypothetical protein
VPADTAAAIVRLHLQGTGGLMVSILWLARLRSVTTSAASCAISCVVVDALLPVATESEACSCVCAPRWGGAPRAWAVGPPRHDSVCWIARAAQRALAAL